MTIVIESLDYFTTLRITNALAAYFLFFCFFVFFFGRSAVDSLRITPQ